MAWREDDPSTRKILEGQTTFRLVYTQKKSCRPLATERPATAMTLFFLVPSNRTFRANVVYMVLAVSSHLSARKILSLERS